MKTSTLMRSLTVAVLSAGGALVVSLTGCGGNGSGSTSRIITGDTQTIATGSGNVNVFAWSRVAADNTVTEVGATVPLAVFQNPPAQGTGPAGAIAVIAFPAQTQTTTYFNHMELHWNPNGHPPAYTMVPHFDLHFYSITPQDVRAVTAPNRPRLPTTMCPPAMSILPQAMSCRKWAVMPTCLPIIRARSRPE